ncbi:MAG: HXXEE domain-containing protein [Saprospiraceae bacterium]
MELKTLIMLLPLAFTLHNIEEVLGMEKWTKSIPSYIHKPVTTKQFGIAVLLFSILGFIIIYTKSYFHTEKDYYFVITGFAGMIFLNVFLPHLLATIILRKYSPGIITGLFINLPLSILILYKILISQILSIWQLIITIIIGGLMGILLAYIFLKIGKQIEDKYAKTQ